MNPPIKFAILRGESTTSGDLELLVLNGTDLPIAPDADMGAEEDTDFVSINDTTNGWVAGKGGSGFFVSCYVTVGESTSTQAIFAVGNEGATCNNDYVHPGDSVTVTLFDAGGNAQGSATSVAVASPTPTTIPVVSSVTPTHGPQEGGIDGSPTGTVAVNTGSTATPEAFWFGGHSVASGFYGVATTNFSAATTPGVFNVVPPAYVFQSRTAQNFGVSVFTADSTYGFSDQDCNVEITGCADEYFYTAPHSGSVSLDFNPALNWSAALGSKTIGQQNNPVAATSCGVGGGTGISAGLTVGGSLSGGPVTLSGGVDLSDSNSGIPEAFIAHSSLVVTNPIVINVNLTGGIAGCEQIGIPDLSIPDVGGLYFQVGGSIAAAVNLNITIAAGTYGATGGWIPGGSPFANFTENCVDSNGKPTTQCVSVGLNAQLTGIVSISPLWLMLGPSQVNVGAGLTVAAEATAGVTINPPDPKPVFNGGGAICFAGNYSAQVNIGVVNFNVQGDWLGPYDIVSTDPALCPLGMPVNAAVANAPDPPTVLAAAPGDTNASLSWTPPVNNGGADITGYNIFQGTSAGGESTTPINSSPIPVGTTQYTATGLTNGTQYFWTIVAINSAGASVASNEANAIPAGAAPTATVPGAPVASITSGDTQASVNWTPPASNGGSPITGYNVFEGTSAGAESATPINASPLAADSTSFNATGLTNGSTYFFTVEAINAVGPSVPSNEVIASPVSTTPVASVPDAPVASAIATDGQASVSWTPPVADGGSPITGYNVFEGTTAGGESTTPVNTTPIGAGATSLTVPNLTDGTTYFFTVVAINAVGPSNASNEVSVTPTAVPPATTVPSQPLGATATPGDGQATVNWTDSADNGGSVITGYNVFEGTTAGGESTTPVNSTPLAADATSLVVPGLTNGTQYFFTVVAINGVGPSIASNEATATPTGVAPVTTVPGAPVATATPGDAQATVGWTAPALNGGSPITGYNVFEGTTAGGELTTPVNATPLAAGATSLVVPGLTNGTQYFFTVEAINAVGPSLDSNEVTATPAAVVVPPAPTAPGAPVATADAGDALATVHWAAPASDGGSGITGYNVFEGTTAGGESTTPINATPLAANATSLNVPGLNNGTTYFFTVVAINGVGPSVASNEVSATPQGGVVVTPPTATVPSAPVAAATATDGSATVDWAVPASDGGSAVTGYKVFEGTTAGGESTTPVNSTPLAPGTTSLVVPGLNNGTTYFFTVVAINGVGPSVASNEVSATPAALVVNSVPGAPVAVATSGDGSATVGWTRPTSDGGSPILGYNVYQGTTLVNTIPLAPNATSLIVPGLTDGTTYSFTVVAINAIGPSVASNEVSATPTGPIVTPPVATVPGAPVATATAGNTQATIKWTAPTSDGGSAITGYNVFEGTTAGGESTTPVNTSPLPANATSFMATGLTNGTNYYFTVVAINGVGPGSPSNEVSAVPAGVVPVATVPCSPTAFHVTSADTTDMLLWAAPTSDGGSPITGYNIFESTTPGGESTTPLNSLPILAGTTAFVATGLKNGTKYYFTVVALNGVGPSNPSLEVSGTPVGISSSTKCDRSQKHCCRPAPKCYKRRSHFSR